MFITEFLLALKVRNTFDGAPVWEVPIPSYLIPPVPKMAEAGAVPEVVAAIADFAALSVYSSESFHCSQQASKPLRRVMRTLADADDVVPLQNILVHADDGWWWFDQKGRKQGPYTTRLAAAMSWLEVALKEPEVQQLLEEAEQAPNENGQIDFGL